MFAVIRAEINDDDVRFKRERVGVGRLPDVGKIAAVQQRRGAHAEVAHVIICPQPVSELRRIALLQTVAVRYAVAHACHAHDISGGKVADEQNRRQTASHKDGFLLQAHKI